MNHSYMSINNTNKNISENNLRYILDKEFMIYKVYHIFLSFYNKESNVRICIKYKRCVSITVINQYWGVY